MQNSRVCSIDGCTDRHDSHGLCKFHAARMRRHGDPHAGGPRRVPRGTLLRYIHEVALPYDGDDCLLWPFGLVPAGYGSVRKNAPTSLAHSTVCWFKYGPRPSANHEAAHSCGVRQCVNPKHLRWATISENALDKDSHGTLIKGEVHRWTKLSDQQVLEVISLGSSNLSHPKIAARFGVSRSLVSKILQGKNDRGLLSP